MMITSIILVFVLVFQTNLPKVQCRYFAIFNKPKSWLQARDSCKRCGGELVNLDESVKEAISNNNLQNNTIWIGNYTCLYPWIRELGCASKPKAFNFIYHNTPEFCSLTCRDDQHFAIEDEKCYCIDRKSTIYGSCPNTSEKKCFVSCNTKYVKVLTKENVYTCDFEDTSCINTSFGEKVKDVFWKRTEDIEDIDAIGSIGSKKGYFLLLQSATNIETIEKKAKLSIHLSLVRTYYCLSFKYFMGDYGSIEIYVLKETGERYIAWRKYRWMGHMWYSTLIDIKGHSGLIIEIYGSAESNYFGKIAIDDIKLQPLACNKEKSLDCNFDESSCEWKQFPDFTLEIKSKIGSKKSGIKDYFLQSKYKTGTSYLTSPKIPLYRANKLCLQFEYFVTNDQFWSIEAFVNDVQILSTFTSKRNKWLPYAMTFENQKNSHIKFIITTKDCHVRIDDISVRSGTCKSDRHNNLYDRSKGKMCSLVDFGDSSRLSVGHCSSVDKQPYICEFEDRHLNSIGCQSGSFFFSNITTGKGTRTKYRGQFTKSPFNEDPCIVSSKNSNTSTKFSSFQHEKYRTVLAVVSVIFSSVVVSLLVLIAFLILKIKRNQNVKERSNLERMSSIENRDRPQEENGTGHGLASLIIPQLKQSTENDSCNHDTEQNRYEVDYSNVDDLTVQQGQDNQIYHEMEEGAYDHFGESTKRRKDLNNENDNIYDHVQNIDLQNNGTRDTIGGR